MSQIFISKNNTSTVALDAGASFIGVPDVLSSFQELDITLFGSPTIAPGTLYFEFSLDGINWDISVPLNLTGPHLVPIPLRVILPFFRIRYINGATPLITFRLATTLHRASAKHLTRFVSQQIDMHEPIENIRAVLHGFKPDGYSSNVPLGNSGELLVGIQAGSSTIGKLDQGNQGIHTQRWMVGLSDGTSFISPATDRIVASSPFATRLSDGSGFYDSTKSTQLPVSLVGGRLDTNIGTWLGSTSPTVGQKTSANSLPVVISSDQNTITIAGTVTSNIGATNGLALDATLTKLTVAQNTGLSSNTQVLIGGSVTTVSPIYTTGNINPISLTTAGALRIDGSSTIQPVSGTLTANQGTGTAATATWSIQLSDGTAFYIGAKTGQFPSGLVGGRLDTNNGAWLGSTAPTVGLKTSTNSIPVVIASDQVVIPISDNSSSLTIDNSTLSVIGGGTEATALRVTIASNSTGVLSINDNGSSVTIDSAQLPSALVSGRLDSNVGAWLGSTAPTVGQKTMVNSIPVVVASNQSNLSTKEVNSSIGTDSNVTASTTSVTLLAANSNRLGATIYNDTTVGNLFVKLGAVASITSFTVRLVPNAYYEIPYQYTGIIDGIWSVAGGAARIVEFT